MTNTHVLHIIHCLKQTMKHFFGFLLREFFELLDFIVKVSTRAEFHYNVNIISILKKFINFYYIWMIKLGCYFYFVKKPYLF